MVPIQLFMDIEIQISYNVDMPQSTLLLLISLQPFQNVKTISTCGQKYTMGQIGPTGRRLPAPGVDVYICILSLLIVGKLLEEKGCTLVNRAWAFGVDGSGFNSKTCHLLPTCPVSSSIRWE